MSASELLAHFETALAEGRLDDLPDLITQFDVAAASNEERYRWALNLLLAGYVQQAQTVSAALSDENLRARLDAVLADSAASEPADDDPFAVEPAVTRSPEQAERACVPSFLRLFGGRRDVHARAWYDERRRRAGYRPVAQPITEQLVIAHLQGALTLGQYLLHPDATCSFGVLDLDASARVMDEMRATHGNEASALDYPPVRELARRLLQSGSRLGIPTFAEDSGGRGVHIWVFFDPRRAARAVRTILSQILAAAGPLPPELGAELYPKQIQLGQRGLSSLVKLPLGVHPVTHRRCHLLDDQLHPIADPLAALQTLQVAPVDAVESVVARRVLALPAPEMTAPEPAPAPPEVPSARGLAEALRQIAPEDCKAACDRMVQGCSILQSLVRKAYEQHRLEPAEARALLYSIGLVGAQTGLIDEVLAAARYPRRELDRVRLGLPSPVGCAKLRRLVTNANCACFTKQQALPYSTPALFAVGQVQPSEPRWKPFAPFLESDERVVQHPLDALGQALARIEHKLDELKKGDR